MNLALDRYADNPIIDELLSWTAVPRKVKSLRGSFPVFRKPFIEVVYDDGETEYQHFPKEGFVKFWAEASVIIDTLTDIELISEFDFPPVADRGIQVNQILESRKECIEECREMFASGFFQIFVDQYGWNCKDLPADIDKNLAEAMSKID